MGSIDVKILFFTVQNFFGVCTSDFFFTDICTFYPVYISK